MKIKQAYATTLMVGGFFVVAISGILMFFNFKTFGIKEIHEYIGMAFVLFGLLHAFANKGAFKRYFSGVKFAVIACFSVICLVATLGIDLGGDDMSSRITKVDFGVLYESVSAINIKEATEIFETRKENIEILQNAEVLNSSIKEAGNHSNLSEREILYLITNSKP